jgi:hypothetical protein
MWTETGKLILMSLENICLLTKTSSRMVTRYKYVSHATQGVAQATTLYLMAKNIHHCLWLVTVLEGRVVIGLKAINLCT